MRSIFKKISSIILFSAIVLSVHTYGLEEAKDCVDPKIMSSKFGDFKGEDMTYTPCGPFLTEVDERFLMVAKILIDKETFVKMKDKIIRLGGNYEKMVEYFDEHNHFQTVIMLLSNYPLTFASVYLFFLGVLVAKNGVSKAALLTMFLAVLIGLAAYMSRYAADGWLLFSSNLNKFLWDRHDVEENVKFFNGENALRLNPESIEASDKALNNFLHLVAATNVSTDNVIRKGHYGSNVEVDFDYRSSKGNDIDEPTIAEYLEMQNECSMKDRAVVEENAEFNISFGNSGLSKYIPKASIISVPFRANFTNGGETFDYNCPQKDFGIDGKIFATLGFEGIALLQKFHQNKHADELADQSTVIEDLASVISTELAYSEKELVNMDVLAGQQLKNITGKIDLAHAIALQSQKSGEDYHSSKPFQSLVQSFKGTFANGFKENKEMDFTLVEKTGLDFIKMGQAKFSTFFSNTKGFDPKLMFNLNGWHYAQPFINKTIQMNLAVDCAISSPSSFIKRKDFAQGWNALDKTSIKNKDATTMSGSSDFHCFVYEDGMLNAEYSNPETVENNIKEIAARKQAIEIVLSAITEAVFQLSVNDPKVFEKGKLEYLNKLRPTVQSAISSQLGFLKMKKDLMNVFATAENLYSFEILDLFDDLSLPQTYFNYARFSKDVVTEQDKATTNQVQGIKSVNLSNLFNNYTKGQFAEPVSDSIEVGIAKLIGDTFITGQCPLRDEKGKCKASLQELNYVSKDNLLNLFITVTATRTAIKVAEGIGAGTKSVADTADKTSLGKTPKGKLATLLAKGVSTSLIALGAAAGWFLDIAWVIVGLLLLLTQIAEFLPTFVEIMFLFLFIVEIIVAALLISFIISKEMSVNLFRMALGGTDIKEITNFDGSIALIISVLTRWIIFYGSIFLFIEMNNNAAIGGAFYSLIESMGSNSSTLATLATSLLMSFAIVMALFSIPKVINYFEESVFKIAGIHSRSAFAETSQYVTTIFGFMTGNVMGRMSSQQKMIVGASEQMGRNIGNSLRKKSANPEDGDEDGSSTVRR